MKNSKKLTLFLLILLVFLPSHKSSAEPTGLWDFDDFGELSTEYVDVIRFRKSPYITSYWKDEFPDVRICADSGVSMSRARSAVHMWRRLGYSMGNIYWDDGSHICATGGVSGEIIIMLVSSDIAIGNNLAVTRTFYDRHTKVIKKSQIFVLGGYANKPRLLEHEIGHALGWAHFNRNLHIMNAHYPDTGTNSHRIRHTDYVRNINFFLSDAQEY